MSVRSSSLWILCTAACLLPNAALRAGPLGNAALDINTSRYHPGDLPAWGWPPIPASSRFTVYTGSGLTENNYSLLSGMVTNFGSDGDQAAGTIFSEVWRDDLNGNLLFRYRVQNIGVAPIDYGNIGGFGPEVEVLDCGVMDEGGDTLFSQGDVLRLRRTEADAQRPQLDFRFVSLGAYELLQPGQTSAWFYAETTSPNYTTGLATLQFGGSAKDMLPVIVPVPEPGSLALLILGFVTILSVRRRRLART